MPYTMYQLIILILLILVCQNMRAMYCSVFVHSWWTEAKVCHHQRDLSTGRESVSSLCIMRKFILGTSGSFFSKFYLTEDDVSIPCSAFLITTLQEKGAVGIQHEYRSIIQSCRYKTTLFAVSAMRKVKTPIPHSCSLNVMVFQLF